MEMGEGSDVTLNSQLRNPYLSAKSLIEHGELFGELPVILRSFITARRHSTARTHLGNAYSILVNCRGGPSP